jgi:hypothetical protein
MNKLVLSLLIAAPLVTINLQASQETSRCSSGDNSPLLPSGLHLPASFDGTEMLPHRLKSSPLVTPKGSPTMKPASGPQPNAAPVLILGAALFVSFANKSGKSAAKPAQ